MASSPRKRDASLANGSLQPSKLPVLTYHVQKGIGREVAAAVTSNFPNRHESSTLLPILELRLRHSEPLRLASMRAENQKESKSNKKIEEKKKRERRVGKKKPTKTRMGKASKWCLELGHKRITNTSKLAPSIRTSSPLRTARRTLFGDKRKREKWAR